MTSTKAEIKEAANALAEALSRHPVAEEMEFEDLGWRIEARKIKERKLQ